MKRSKPPAEERDRLQSLIRATLDHAIIECESPESAERLRETVTGLEMRLARIDCDGAAA